MRTAILNALMYESISLAKRIESDYSEKWSDIRSVTVAGTLMLLKISPMNIVPLMRKMIAAMMATKCPVQINPSNSIHSYFICLASPPDMRYMAREESLFASSLRRASVQRMKATVPMRMTDTRPCCRRWQRQLPTVRRWLQLSRAVLCPSGMMNSN